MPDYELNAIRSDVKRIESEVNELYKTVYKGNGSPSLVSQTIKFQNSIDNLKTNLDQKIESLEEGMGLRIADITNLINEKFKHLELQIHHEFEAKKINVEGSWKMKVAVVSSITAIIASLVPPFIMQLLHILK